jgi:hypothetical protein
MVDDRPDGTLQEPESAADNVILYSNYAAVTATPEEFILRWCQREVGDPTKPIERVRVYISLWHAKRLLAALARTIQTHEELFGPIEERALTPEAQKKFGIEKQEEHPEEHDRDT